MLDSQLSRRSTETKMAQLGRRHITDSLPLSSLIRAIGRFAQTDGDYDTAIPALRLHRRAAPTEPLHCIYNSVSGWWRRGRSRY